MYRFIQNYLAKIATATALLCAPAFAGTVFFTGDLVVSVEGNGVVGATSGPYTDNQAAPLSLFQYSTTGTSSASFVSSFVLPQTASGANFAVSGEYGSSSEGSLQLSGNGQYLTIMGYGINAATFNGSPGTYSASNTNTALAQSGSLTGQSYTPVARVVALIDGNGNVNSSTGLYNVFNGNNPRSAYTADGTNIYVSGQGTSGDNTSGVFYTTQGSSSATAITGLDTTTNTVSQDTRSVQIYKGQLYVSTDTKGGSGSARSFIGTLGSAGSPPTSLANSSNGPTQLTGFGSSKTGQLTVTAGNTNGVNTVGKVVNLSPENYFFASPSVLYVADSGDGKQNSGNSSVGDGGLQKWVNSQPDGSGAWTLEYTLAAGLGLVANTSASGTTGLEGLTGEVINGNVELFATNYTIGDLDQTYLFGITDAIGFATSSQASGESFTTLATAPADSQFKGVSLAPTPEPATFAIAGLALGILLVRRRRMA